MDKMPDIKVNVNGNNGLRLVYEPVQEKKLHAWNYCNYTLESINAVIDIVLRRGSEANTCIFVNNSGVSVILDDSIQDRPLDRVTYIFKISDLFKDLRRLLKNQITQKELVDFLKRHNDDEIVNRETLIANFSKVNFNTKISSEFSLPDSYGNITIMYKEENGTEGSVNIPAELYVQGELLLNGVYVIKMKVDLEVIKPKSSDEKPRFVLQVHEWQKHLRCAVEKEKNYIQKKLKPFLILDGSPE